MKIVHLVDELKFGGLETHLASYINELLKRNRHIFLYSQYIDQKFLNLIIDKKDNFIYTTGENNLLLKLQDFKPDIIHAHPFAAITKGAMLARSIQTPFIVTIHGLYNWALENIELAKTIDRIIAVDQGVTRFLNDVVAYPEKISIVRNGLNLQMFKPLPPSPVSRLSLGLNPDIFTIVLVSRFSADKRISIFQLLRIAPILAHHLHGLNIIMVGDGDYYNAALHRSISLNHADPQIKIRLVGYQHDVTPYLAMADLVIACDRAALEAMACRRPVFAAYQNGLAGAVNGANFDNIIFSRGGYYYPLSDNEAIKQLTNLINDKKALDTITAECYEIIQSQYDIVDAVDQLENIYRQYIK